MVPSHLPFVQLSLQTASEALHLMIALSPEVRCNQALSGSEGFMQPIAVGKNIITQSYTYETNGFPNLIYEAIYVFIKRADNVITDLSPVNTMPDIS